MTGVLCGRALPGEWGNGEAPEAWALPQVMGAFRWGQVLACQVSLLFRGQEARVVTSSSLPGPRERHL